MPRFAANLTMLFTELPFMERFEAAAKAGFKAVEYLFPYAYDKKELTAALRANGLQQVLHNLPAGNWDGGERGIGCHPDRVSEFREGVGMAIDYATALGCPSSTACWASCRRAWARPRRTRWRSRTCASRPASCRRPASCC